MNKVLSSIALLSLSASVFAGNNSPQNLVERPLTLVDGEFLVAGAVMFGEQTDGDNKWRILPGLAYGVTDNLTLGLGDIRYRFMDRADNKTGLELTVGIGFSGHLEVEEADGDDEHLIGLGVDISGKYVFNRDTALLFSTEYVRWEEFLDENRSEFRYSVGVERNIYKDVTAFARYTFSDLKDFEEDYANSGSLGVNYAITKTTDIGIFANYSDFDAEQNGYKAENVFEKSAGIYFATRF